MKIAFHSNTLGVRGSENALMDYAEFNQTILGNHSVLVVQDRAGIDQNPTMVEWRSRFAVCTYRNRFDLGEKLRDGGVDALYMIKPGYFDGLVVPGVRNCIHAMYHSDEFHGDAFAFVSAWLSREATGRADSFVPHFLRRFKSAENLRNRLGIPSGAKVFGRHGGAESFNISFVRQAIVSHARLHPEDHFVFLNTLPMEAGEGLPNLHHLPPTMDPSEKGKFFATCDAMIHAQWHGETFGMAPGEFAVLGKPVLTYGCSKVKAHLELLGDHALIYRNEVEVSRLLRDFEPHEVWGTDYERYADPAEVMNLFRERFLAD
jgi:hypothetical protein